MSALAAIDNQQGCINSLISIVYNGTSYLISGGEVNGTKIWNSKNSTLTTINSDGPVHALAYLENYRYLAVGSANNLKIWEMQNYKYVHDIVNSENLGGDNDYQINVLAILPQYIVGAIRKSIHVWHSTSFKHVKSLLPGHTATVNVLVVFEPTHYIISGSDDNTIRIRNSTSFELFKTLEYHTNSVKSLAIMPRTQYLINMSRLNCDFVF